MKEKGDLRKRAPRDPQSKVVGPIKNAIVLVNACLDAMENLDTANVEDGTSVMESTTAVLPGVTFLIVFLFVRWPNLLFYLYFSTKYL